MEHGIWRITVKTILGFLIGLGHVHCTQEPNASIEKYYDVEGFLDKQVEILQNQETHLIKTLNIGDETDTEAVSSLDSLQWQKEFKIFREHDINKPVLLDAYSVEERGLENGNNQIIYTLRDSNQLGILDLVFKFNPDGQVTDWESSFKEENILYSNLREVSMSFTPDGARMTGFAVNGYHKLMFKDTVFYQVHAKIDYEK